MPLVSKTFSEIITFTRATSGTYFDATGTLQSAGNNVARFDYDPSTLAPRGFLIEEQRTNSIRNNTMQGAVAGTPGTVPTNWSTYTSLTGLATQIVGTGTDSGISYIDFRVSGTPSGAGQFGIYFEGNTGIAASNGQTWSQSAYLKLQAGSFTGVTDTRLQSDERAASSYIRSNTSSPLTITSSALNTQRFANTMTLTGGATVAYILPYVIFNLSGAAIDVTLRIGLPQMELGAFATSVIPTSTVAVTRNTDVASVNTLSPWYNASAGTLYAEYVRFGALNFQNIASLGNAAQTEQATLVFGSGAPSNNQRFDVTSGGVSQASITVLTSPALNTIAKTAGAYAANDFAATANGAVPGTDPSGTVPAPTTLSLGTGAALTGPFLNGWLRRITYYPRRLSNAELQTLTT